MLNTTLLNICTLTSSSQNVCATGKTRLSCNAYFKRLSSIPHLTQELSSRGNGLNTFVSKWVFSDTVEKKKKKPVLFISRNEFFVHPLFSHFITWGEFTYAFPRLCFRRLIWVDKAKGNNDNNDEENAKDCNTQKYCMMMLRRTGRLGSI